MQMRVRQSEPRSRLLTVSNRGPVEFHRDDDGKVIAAPGPGGLATALRIASRLYPTTWLSSPISPVDREIAAGETTAPEEEGVSHFVSTDAAAYDLFYGRFSNEVLWLLQHSLAWPEELTPERRREAWEDGYVAVNEAFANAVVEELHSCEFRAVMFHDYLFYTAPALVRRVRPDVYLQHFIHIPWPEVEQWQRLERDMVRAICEGLLANDSLVFQTRESVENFLQTCQEFVPSAEVDLVDGIVIGADGRETRVWSNGISVDPEELEEAAATREFSSYRYLLRPNPGQKMIVRVDRLDLSKNVYRGFEAYARLFEQHPELREKVTFLALLIPTRKDIPSYRRYQEDTQALAESINKRFGNLHWKPIRIFFEDNRVQALAAMSLYDVLLVNPVADGMNLVAKEGPFLNTRDGVLVLSRRAGAFGELGCGALAIDPEDVQGTADSLYHALTMPAQERHERSVSMRRTIRSRDLRTWFSALLSDIEGNAPRAKVTAA
jgi:trehalose 6-phosphate synthase